jgi:hypothetical protein
VAFFKPIFAAYMDHYGYQDDWTLHPTPTINPAHASEYVANLIQKRRGLPS